MIGLVLSVLIAAPVGQNDGAPAFDQAAYQDVVRCYGVLNNAREGLSQRDPRQRDIAEALGVIDARLQAAAASGAVDEIQVVADLQSSVNASVNGFQSDLPGCSAAYAPTGTAPAN